MSFLSDYEKLRLKNIEENKKVLAELGFDKPFCPFPSLPKKQLSNKQVKRKRSEEQRPRKERAIAATALGLLSEVDEGRPTRRRSGRLLGKEPGSFQGLDFELEEEEEKPRKIQRNRENVFGPIPGIQVGTTWSTRLACSADGVHRPTVAGIHGNTEEGCYSLALSGGYEDDLDYGNCFTYTGEGGRDLKGTKANPKNLRTAPQSKDQTLTRGNLALTKNVEKGRPVRVIRGYKLDSPFAPEEGYRYDGIYSVEKYWKAVGMSGFMVFKFALKRCDNQTPAVWEVEENDNDSEKTSDDETTEDLPTDLPAEDEAGDNRNSKVTNGVTYANKVEKGNEMEEMKKEGKDDTSSEKHQGHDKEVYKTEEHVTDEIHQDSAIEANENKDNKNDQIHENKDDVNDAGETKEQINDNITRENGASEVNKNKEISLNN